MAYLMTGDGKMREWARHAGNSFGTFLITRPKFGRRWCRENFFSHDRR